MMHPSEGQPDLVGASVVIVGDEVEVRPSFRRPARMTNNGELAWDCPAGPATT